MNRKTIERNQEKYDAGLRKHLLNIPLDNWKDVLDDALHHLAKNQLTTDDNTEEIS